MESDRPYVDPQQLQAELDRGFGSVSDELSAIRNLWKTMFALDNMILRALLDLNLINPEQLQDALRHLKANHPDEPSQAILDALMSQHARQDGSEDTTTSHLRLVPTADSGTNPPNAPRPEEDPPTER